MPINIFFDVGLSEPCGREKFRKDEIHRSITHARTHAHLTVFKLDVKNFVRMRRVKSIQILKSHIHRFESKLLITTSCLVRYYK